MPEKCDLCSSFMEKRSSAKYRVVWRCNECSMSFPDRSTLKSRYAKKLDTRYYSEQVPDTEYS